MSLAELLTYVEPANQGEVERIYASFVAGFEIVGAAHIDSFAKLLGARGLMSPERLHDFMTWRGVRLGPSDESLAGATGPARYEFMALIAHGGMGDVYLGSEPTLKRTIAVKRLPMQDSADAIQYRRFVTEAQVTAQLDHPAIVPVYGFERSPDGTLAYAMKFVRGVTLAAFIDETERQIAQHGRPDGPHSLKARVATLVPVLNALAYAHRRGVMHRDLKPENVMVGGFGEVLVMDWGIARVFGTGAPVSEKAPTRLQSRARGTAEQLRATVIVEGEEHTDESSVTRGPGITREGDVLGTPDFMSPEQARGEPLDAASDQYSLGLMLQELVTLRAAIPGRSSNAVLERARGGERAPIVETHEHIPRELRSIIAKATAPAKEDRYPSVGEMADDVRRYLRDESVLADPDSGVRRVTRWIGNHRGTAMASGIGLVLLSIAVATLFLWRARMEVATQQRLAGERERALMGLSAHVDAHCERITESFHAYEKLLAELATSARILMTTPAPPSQQVVYRYAGGRREPTEAPPYARNSSVYGPAKSVRHADYTAAAGVDPPALQSQVDQLAMLEPVLRATLLASAPEKTAGLSIESAERLVLQRGLPIAWTYFATRSGVSIGMPGTWDYQASPGIDGYDHRREQWYIDAIAAKGTVWSSDTDENGRGLLMTCATSVSAPTGEMIGVAAIDLALTQLIEDYLEIPAFSGMGAEALLLDREGKVQVRSSQKQVAASLVHYIAPVFEEASVVAGMRRADIGHVILPGERIAVWNALGKFGLVYVVVGPEARMLEYAAAL